MRFHQPVAGLLLLALIPPKTQHKNMPKPIRTCGRGAALRIVKRSDPSHIFVVVQSGGKDADSIAAIWRRPLQRIPDVRLVDDISDADVAILVSGKEIKSEDGSLGYAWFAQTYRPWFVSCDGV